MSADGMVPPPPEGFDPAEIVGEFSIHNGPIFRRTPPDGEGGPTQALFILPRHTNGLGVLHGGMLSTFLDSLLGLTVRQSCGRWAMTVHLSIDFQRMARQGEWLLGEAAVSQVAGDLAFVDGRAFVGERPVGRASGVFKLMRRGS